MADLDFSAFEDAPPVLDFSDFEDAEPIDEVVIHPPEEEPLPGPITEEDAKVPHEGVPKADAEEFQPEVGFNEQESIELKEPLEGPKEPGLDFSDFEDAPEEAAPRQSVKAFIRRFEAGEEDPYNNFNRGTAGEKGSKKKENLTEMTISEIREKQKLPKENPDRLLAVGAYQFIGPTMQRGLDALGIDENEKFTEEIQDRLGDWALDNEVKFRYKGKNYTGGDFLDGRVEDNKETRALMQNALAKVWAIIPNTSGKSEYEGLAGNKALPKGKRHLLQEAFTGTFGKKRAIKRYGSFGAVAEYDPEIDAVDKDRAGSIVGAGEKSLRALGTSIYGAIGRFQEGSSNLALKDLDRFQRELKEIEKDDSMPELEKKTRIKIWKGLIDSVRKDAAERQKDASQYKTMAKWFKKGRKEEKIEGGSWWNALTNIAPDEPIPEKTEKQIQESNEYLTSGDLMKKAFTDTAAFIF